MIKNVYIDTAFGVGGMVLTYLFGSLDTLLFVLAAVMVLDYISGMLASWITKEWNSEKGYKGILKKILILLIVMLGVLLDRALANDSWLFRNMVLMFFIANESLSILENSANCGLPIPQKLIDVLEQVKKESETNDENL